MIGGRRKLHNEDLHNLYLSPSVIVMIKSRQMRWARHVAQRGGDAYRIFVGKPKGKRPLGRPRLRVVDPIILDLRQIELHCMDWIDLAQDSDQWNAFGNTAVNLRVPYNAGKFLSGCTTISFSRSVLHHE
jgi:hypothetical protein